MNSHLIPPNAPSFIIFSACLAGFLTLLIFTVAIVNLIDYQSKRIKEEALQKFPLGGSSRERRNLKHLSDRLSSSIFAFVFLILALMLTDVFYIVGIAFSLDVHLVVIVFFLLLFLIPIFCSIFYFKFYLIFKNSISFTMLPPNQAKSRIQKPRI